MRLSGRDIGAGVVAVLLVLGAAVLGLNEAAGAHPWWAVRSGIIGGVIGIAGFSGLRWLAVPRLWVMVLGVVIFAAAMAAAYLGKQAFVMSIGEDVSAGKLWYFGWFGVSAGAVVTIAALLAGVMRRERA